MSEFIDLANALDQAAQALDERGKEALILGLAALLRQIEKGAPGGRYIDAAVSLIENLLALPPKGKRRRRSATLRIMPR